MSYLEASYPSRYVSELEAGLLVIGFQVVSLVLAPVI